MNHLEFAEMENYNLSNGRDEHFKKWMDEAASLMNVSDLDGDDEVEGYSLDSAYNACWSMISPSEYASGKRI